MEPEEIQSGESERLEFKERLPEDSRTYLKTVIAFANGKGGQIVFGVRDSDCAVVGIEPDGIFRTMDTITNAIYDGCEPPISPDISLQNFGDKTVLIISINGGRQRPYHIKSQGPMKGTYVRVARTTRHADDATIREMYYEDSGKSFDRSPAPQLSVTDAELKSLCRMLTETAQNNSDSDSQRRASRPVTPAVLESWGVLRDENGKWMPNQSYGILLGKDALLNKIQCGLFRGKTRANFLDKQDCNGFLAEQIEEAMRFILRNIRMGCTFEGVYRKDIYELPPDSIRELIVNAVLHRSYLQPSSVQVAIYDDRLEITSPGGWVEGTSLEKAKKGCSKVRNNALASSFAYMRLTERWGSGIPRVLSEMRLRNLPEPEFSDLNGFLRINLYRPTLIPPSSPSKKTVKISRAELSIGNNSEYATILNVLEKYPEYTQSQLAAHLGTSLSTIKRACSELKKQGILSHEGSSRAGHWVINRN